MTYQVIPDHPESIRFPLMEKPFLGFLLAFMAGTMDAWTLGNAQTFATVQSGNVVSSGYWLVQGDWPKFTFAFGSVIAFGIGSLLCGIMMTKLLRHNRIFTPEVLFIEAVALAGLGVMALNGTVDPHYIAYAVSFLAGAQGNAFHKSHGMLYGNVAVTFVVQMAFNFLIQSVFSKKGINGEPNLMWAGIFFLVLFGFAAGGAIGFLIDSFVDGVTLFVPAVIAALIGVDALWNRRQALPVDPTPGGLIG